MSAKAALTGLAALGAIASLNGCSTIIHGTSDRVTITSTEGDAEIFVNGVRVGKGSGITALERGEIHTIRVEKPGCEAVTVQTDDSFDPTSLLGILIDFGVITIPVDLITGAAWKIEPRIYNVDPACPRDARLATRARSSNRGDRGADDFGMSRSRGGFDSSNAAVYLGFSATRSQAENNTEFMWLAESDLLGESRPVVQERIDPSTGLPRFHMYGADLPRFDAEAICEGLEDRGYLCRVVDAQS